MPIQQLNETKSSAMSPFPTRKPEMEKVQCSCGCTYFEEIKVQQFPRLHNITVGQEMMPIDGLYFYVMKCINCASIVAPQVIFGQQDMRSKAYHDFIAKMKELDKAATETTEGKGEAV